jgi:hypothetical protein
VAHGEGEEGRHGVLGGPTGSIMAPTRPLIASYKAMTVIENDDMVLGRTEPPLSQVWCVAYDDPEPHMDGVRRIRMGEWPTREHAINALMVMTSRSHYAPKANATVEYRWVTPWAADLTNEDPA